MRNDLIAAISLVLFTASCQPNKESKLLGDWQAVRSETPVFDQEMAEAAVKIDTMGRNGNAATNLVLYETTNIDSLRQALMVQLQEVIAAKNAASNSTVFHFMPDRKIIIDFNGHGNEGKWNFVNGDPAMLEIEEGNGEDKGRKIVMTLLAQSADSMTVKIPGEEEGTYSNVTFARVKK